MDIATYERETAIHKKLYEQLREQIQKEHNGQYITLAGGRMFATATFAEAQAVVKHLDPVPEYFLIFPAEIEPDFELAYEFWTMTV